MFSDFCLSFAVYLYYYFGHHFVEFNCRAGLETHCGLVVPCDEVLIYCGSANRQLKRHGCRSSSSFEYRRRRTTVVKSCRVMGPVAAALTGSSQPGCSGDSSIVGNGNGGNAGNG